MRMSRNLPAAAMAGAVSAMTVVGVVLPPPAHAISGDVVRLVAGSAADGLDGMTRITLPGAGPLYYPNFLTTLPGLGQIMFLGTDQNVGSASLLQAYDLLNHEIGENWFPGSTAQVVNYPASIGLLSGGFSAPDANQSIATGQAELNDQIMNAATNGNGNHVVVAGLSMGAIVINRELASLATDPHAPAADALQFVSFSNPELGLAGTYLPTGTFIPLINYTVGDLPDTQYDVSVVFSQYDAWANPPDRPWNLLADLNALFGSLLGHDAAALAAMSDAELISSVTSALGGTIDTYMIPEPILPMLEVLQYLGVPAQTVDDLNSLLKPIVDQGYSVLTPDAGPYFSHGELLDLPSLFDLPAATGFDLAPVDLAGLL